MPASYEAFRKWLDDCAGFMAGIGSGKPIASLLDEQQAFDPDFAP